MACTAENNPSRPILPSTSRTRSGPRLSLLQEIFAGEFRRCPLGPGRDQRRSDLNQHASWQQLRGGNFRYRDLTGPCVLKKLLHAVAAV